MSTSGGQPLEALQRAALYTGNAEDGSTIHGKTLQRAALYTENAEEGSTIRFTAPERHWIGHVMWTIEPRGGSQGGSRERPGRYGTVTRAGESTATGG